MVHLTPGYRKQNADNKIMIPLGTPYSAYSTSTTAHRNWHSVVTGEQQVP